MNSKTYTVMLYLGVNKLKGRNSESEVILDRNFNVVQIVNYERLPSGELSPVPETILYSDLDSRQARNLEIGIAAFRQGLAQTETFFTRV